MSIYYDTLAKRWVIPGSDDKPRMYIPDANDVIVSGFKGRVGTTPAVGVGTSAIAVATMTNTADLLATDRIVLQPKGELTLGMVSARMYSDGCMTVKFVNPAQAVATQAAIGWDILAIRTE